VLFMDLDPRWDLVGDEQRDFFGQDLGVGRLEGLRCENKLVPKRRSGRDIGSEQVTLVRVLAQLTKFLGQVELNVLGLPDLDRL